MIFFTCSVSYSCKNVALNYYCFTNWFVIIFFWKSLRLNENEMFIYHINISIRNGAKKCESWSDPCDEWGPCWKVIMALQIAFTLWETREHQFGNFRQKKITNIDHTISYYTYSFNVVYRLLLLFGWILYTIFFRLHISNIYEKKTNKIAFLLWCHTILFMMSLQHLLSAGWDIVNI